MGKRSRIGGSYVTRDKKGRFVKWTNIGKSTAADKRKKTRRKLKKPGFGHMGDYKQNR